MAIIILIYEDSKTNLIKDIEQNIENDIWNFLNNGNSIISEKFIIDKSEIKNENK